MTLIDVFLFYVCPTIGSVLATVMFTAPVNDMRKALAAGDLGCLDPVPFVFAAGNTLGWCVYGYLLGDPFLVAANLPSFLVSLWLNYGAAKLQYYQIQQRRMQRNAAVSATQQITEDEEWDASPPLDHQEDETMEPSLALFDNSPEIFVFVPQETQFFRMMVAWAALTTYASWFTDIKTGSTLVGFAVNINLIFFYGSPLNTIRIVVRQQDSSAIHRPTLTMNFVNTSFWIAYGMAQKNIMIIAPNATGLLLGVAQAILCILFPAKGSHESSVPGAAAPTSSIAATMTPQAISQDVDDFE